VPKPPITLTVTLKADEDAVAPVNILEQLARLQGLDGLHRLLTGATLTIGFVSEIQAITVREQIEQALADRPVLIDVETKLSSKRGAPRTADMGEEEQERRAVVALTPMEALLARQEEPEDAGDEPLSRRITRALADYGPQTLEALAEKVRADREDVEHVLEVLHDQGDVDVADGRWRMAVGQPPVGSDTFGAQVFNEVAGQVNRGALDRGGVTVRASVRRAR